MTVPVWLGAIRGLTPDQAELADPIRAGLPRVFTTEAWGRRLLSAQLASWAELRHDTLLYAKQSYSMGILCEFPDVYVDPYPELFWAVADYANAGHEQTAALGLAHLDLYFTRLGQVANTLADMAVRQRQDLEVSEEHLEFANNMIRIVDVGVCGPELTADGWYTELFVAGADPLAFDPTIADVHTQPTDEVGNMVGRILHVGTGAPRLMTVVVDTPEGPRAYMGAVSSYYEVITDDFDRLTDERWASSVSEAVEVDWMSDLIAR